MTNVLFCRNKEMGTEFSPGDQLVPHCKALITCGLLCDNLLTSLLSRDLSFSLQVTQTTVRRLPDKMKLLRLHNVGNIIGNVSPSVTYRVPHKELGMTETGHSQYTGLTYY